MKLYKVRFLPEAYNDIKEARKWYKQHNLELPKRFVQQINISINRIKETPFAYAVRYKEVHIANIGIFPYSIHYLVTDDSIIIIAIYHTAINPEKWHQRVHT